MSGIYIHIPFCKQACHYCDFHFSTSMKKRGVLVDALCSELMLRKEEQREPIQTIYFGGGTPSLLTSEELEQIFQSIHQHYEVDANAEITLEANPDDLTEEKVTMLGRSEINRLSIGVQSFSEEDLKLMNRAHNATEATESIQFAKKHFKNISVDLIYGIPGMSNERWEQNLQTALQLKIPHLSCYALQVEPKTALEKFIKNGVVPPVDDEMAKAQYEILIAQTVAAGYENYEFSSFGWPDWHSRNNTAYWNGKSYLGIGPSAHGYNGTERSWNVSNNALYIKAIVEGKLPIERELLSVTDSYNEYVMIRLRTKKGISLTEIKTLFGARYYQYLLEHASPHLEAKQLQLLDDYLQVTSEGAFLTDGIASDLFWIA